MGLERRPDSRGRSGDCFEWRRDGLRFRSREGLYHVDPSADYHTVSDSSESIRSSRYARRRLPAAGAHMANAICRVIEGSGHCLRSDHAPREVALRRCPQRLGARFGLSSDDRSVYVPYASGRHVALDQFTGAERWRTTDARDAFNWPAMSIDNFVYLAGGKGGFVAFLREARDSVWSLVLLRGGCDVGVDWRPHRLLEGEHSLNARSLAEPLSWDLGWEHYQRNSGFRVRNGRVERSD